MMAKEAGACLAEVVRQAAASRRSALADRRGGKKEKECGGGSAPAANASGQHQQQQRGQPSLSLLEAIGGAARVDGIGRMLLSALGRMKHMGGIQCTQVG
jgi:hypothetical protein